jgi:serine/threonine-protein kinase
MALSVGTRIGPYEVTGTLGAGGMGEVYRARDARLARDVALKVLPDAFASDPDRLARFEREAHVLAALKHPNIAAIYGLEEAPAALDGARAGEAGHHVRALVLELVEGETLADRITRGPIPLEDAIPIAKAIAEALEAAHEQGVIHRDLKPANIKAGADGAVKVLDFGLAKLTQAPGPGPQAPAMTASPTLSVQATMAGVILGTAAYMSPEQARGRPVDKRADIWAFGCVLYEMLTAKRAFDGDDITDTIVAIVSKEPDWSALPAGTPSTVRSLLRRCLDKDAKRRLRDIGEARLALDEDVRGVRLQPDLAGPREAGRDVRSRRRTALVSSAALAIGAAIATGLMWVATRPAPPRVSRLVVAPDGDASLRIQGASRDVAITPDGAQVIYAGGMGGNEVFVRRLDQLDAASVGRFEQPRDPFVSPDGQWIGFFSGNTRLNKVAITGGPAVTIGAVDGVPRGATWGVDDTIVLATGNPGSGLQRISAAGGEVTVLTKPNADAGELDHWWPQLLPGGRAVLFTIVPRGGGGFPAIEDHQVALLDLQTGAHKILVRGGSHAQYVPSGHLVYGVSGTLRGVPFDLARMELAGNPVPVVPELITSGTGMANFDVAGDGTLVYVRGGWLAGPERSERSSGSIVRAAKSR